MTSSGVPQLFMGVDAFVPEVNLLLKPLKPLPDEGVVPSPSRKTGAPVVMTSGGGGGERGRSLSSSPSSAETLVEVSCFHGMLMWDGVLDFLFSPPSKSNTNFFAAIVLSLSSVPPIVRHHRNKTKQKTTGGVSKTSMCVLHSWTSPLYKKSQGLVPRVMGIYTIAWTCARMNTCIASCFAAYFIAKKHSIVHVLSSVSQSLAPHVMPVKFQRRRVFKRSSTIIMFAVVLLLSIIAGSEAQQVSLHSEFFFYRNLYQHMHPHFSLCNRKFRMTAT